MAICVKILRIVRIWAYKQTHGTILTEPLSKYIHSQTKVCFLQHVS